MRPLPFALQSELEGWRLLWAHLVIVEQADEALTVLRQQVAHNARARFADTAAIGGHATVSALRKLFRAAGTDPTRYRPASEALLRRLVKGSPLPAIQPLVDLNNCLSVELAVPCCVMVDGSFSPSLRWRSGRSGESYESLRGPFNLEGKPVLLDDQGPLDTPITGSQRVKVQLSTRRAWLVAYMPEMTIEYSAAAKALMTLAQDTGIEVEVYAPAS